MLRATNPKNGQVIREVPTDSPATVESKLQAAAEAFSSWRKTSFDERAQLLGKVASYLREHVEELAPIMTEEMGKPIKEARGEVEKSALCCDHYAEFGNRDSES